MGNAQRLPSGNTLIGWGSGAITLSEVNTSGNVLYELSLPLGQYSYRAFRFELNPIITGTQPQKSFLDNFILNQNFPNPFNSSTIISWNMPEKNSVKISVYDVLGKEICVLVNGEFNPGSHNVRWESGSIPSGVYFYKISAGNFSQVKRMILLK